MALPEIQFVFVLKQEYTTEFEVKVIVISRNRFSKEGGKPNHVADVYEKKCSAYASPFKIKMFYYYGPQSLPYLTD